MNLLSNYPTSAPIPAFYLPYTKRRERLSVIDQVLDPYYKYCQLFKEKYTEVDFFENAEAIKLIDSAIKPIIANFSKIAFKNGQPFFTEEEKSVVIGILIKKKDEEIKGLEDRPLSIATYSKIQRILLGCMKEINLENPSTHIQSDFLVTKKDFLIAGNPDYSLEDPFVPVCYDYVFYQLNEVNAFPYLFHSNEIKLPAQFLSDPITALKGWGYDLVKEPKPGDLVVYCSTLKGKLQTKHWGIWTENGKVISKHGIDAVYTHPIDDVIIGYGNFVYFFHKKIKAQIMSSFLKEIESATKATKDFSHPAVYSPLTSLGTIRRMGEIFVQMQIKQVFERSIYNVEYNLKIKEIAIREVEKLQGHCDGDLPLEALEKMRQLVCRVSEEE